MDTMNFRFEGRAKTLTYVLMGIGLVAMVPQVSFTDDSHGHQRFLGQHVGQWFFLLLVGFGRAVFLRLAIRH